MLDGLFSTHAACACLPVMFAKEISDYYRCIEDYFETFVHIFSRLFNGIH